MTISWGYKKAFIHCACLFLAGTMLQWGLGDVPNSFLQYPWGLILAVFYLYMLFVIIYLTDKHPRLRRLYDHYACVSSLSSMVIITILFGLIRQDENASGLLSTMGFTRMTLSWPFNILLLYFTTVLGLSVINDLSHLRQRKAIPVLSHFCVFIILVAGIFGSGDKIRVQVTVQQNEPIATGTHKGMPYPLPFTITLNKFTIDEYPVKLYIVDTQNGHASKEIVSVEKQGDEKDLGPWHLTVNKYYETAIPDSIGFQALNHIGAVPAIHLTVTNRNTLQQQSGWVSCGSFLFDSHYLMLDHQYALFMPPRIAKHYLSEITTTSDNGETHDFNIEVNHPAKLGHWRIYQVGYDFEKGKWSTISVLECIRDRWYTAIHIALWGMLLTNVYMLLSAGSKRKEKKS